MRIGIVTALTSEAAALRRGGAGSYGSIIRGGIGPERAAVAARTLVGDGAEALLAWGTAGALVPSLRPGTLLLPRRIHSADGAEHAAEPGWHAHMLETLASLGPELGSLHSSDHVIASTAEKLALSRASDACAVDMESAAVAQVADLHRLPFLAIRAILDPADFTLPRPALTALRSDGSLDLPGFTAALLRSPWALLPLLRLQGFHRGAIATLETAARHLATAA